MSVVFVNYGIFNSNSGSHTAHFANALAKAGEDVWVLGSGDPDSVGEFGDAHFRTCRIDTLKEGVPADLARSLRKPGALIHGWTPRETVRLAIERLVAETGAPYFIHLEDNEDVVAQSQQKGDWALFTESEVDPNGKPFPPHLSHPVRHRSLLKGAAGITVIAQALDTTVPEGARVHLLEPGVDADTFAPDMPEAERRAARRALFIPEDARVLVYHGNMHAANQRDMFSLYTGMMILKRRGLPVVMIRSGVDHGDDFDVAMDYLKKDVINLGHLPRADMIAALKLADAYVQPGAADEFNIYRLPSKVPEFLALGRPVVLPRANVGLRLKDQQEAVILDRGDGLDIADHLETLLHDPDRMAKIGQAGRAFALRELDWDRNAAGLRDFYGSVLPQRAGVTGRAKTKEIT